MKYKQLRLVVIFYDYFCSVQSTWSRVRMAPLPTVDGLFICTLFQGQQF